MGDLTGDGEPYRPCGPLPHLRMRKQGPDGRTVPVSCERVEGRWKIMKFVCSGMALSEGLRRVSGALPTRTVNQVLEGVKIVTLDGGVRLTASDERTTIVTDVPATVEEEGSGVAPGKLLGEVVRGLVNGDVTVSMNNRFVFTVKGGDSRTNLAGQDAELFPALTVDAGEIALELPQGMLKRMIEKTAFCVATEDMREVLTGALLECKRGDMCMVGLDGFRMAVCKGVTCAEDCAAIIPGKALMDLGKLLGDDMAEMVQLSIGGGKLMANVAGTVFYATLIEGEFVNWRGIMPKSYATRATVGVDALRRAVDRASLIARQGNNNLVVLRMHGDEMAVESKSQIGDVHEAVSMALEGAELDIAFNVKYISDALRSVAGDEVTLNMNGAISPCTMSGDDDVIYMVLPVRTGATG